MIPALALLVLSHPAPVFLVLSRDHAHMNGVCWKWKGGKPHKQTVWQCKGGRAHARKRR